MLSSNRDISSSKTGKLGTWKALGVLWDGAQPTPRLGAELGAARLCPVSGDARWLSSELCLSV